MAIRALIVTVLLACVVWPQANPAPQNPAGEKKDSGATKPGTERNEPCIVDTEAGGPPRLKRGKPTDRKPAPGCQTLATPIGGAQSQPDEDAPPTPANARVISERTFDSEGTPVAAEKAQPATLIDKVRLKSSTYLQNLPNFICQQLVRRMQSATRRGNWSLKDTVTVEVAYVDGVEEYRNAKHNSKAIKYDDLQKTGTWSKGEYGTVLNDILHPATDAQFTYKRMDSFGGVETEMWEYVVQKDNSHWTLNFGGQSTQPKYRGAIWIDPKEQLLRRIEMEALNLPSTFPVNHAEMTLDYGPVKIGTAFFILPTKTENLACFRGESVCVRNETEFRNYRKFTTESTISTTESNISFDGEDKKPAVKKK